jgi:hypothetical protein
MIVVTLFLEAGAQGMMESINVTMVQSIDIMPSRQ